MKRKNSARTRALKTLCLSLTYLTAVPMLASPATAQSDTSQKSYDFSIGAQSLSSALTAFAAETGLQIVYSQEDAGQISSPGVRGRMTADQALSRITSGTGYTFQYLRAGVVTLVKAGNDGELVTGAVQVEGVQGSSYFGGAGQAAGVNGINGSRDITATEGTGSFTSGALTIGSKVPQALKDVPQSISVLTSERLEQQNVTDFTTAMKQLPGVTLVQGATSLENFFFSRGFVITSIQVDGGAPISTDYNFFPQIDMSIYDHVELLRGAAGQFGAYGNPGGTVNLVRKKPLDHAQFSVEAQAGSWSNYRVVADATSPLTLDGKLRGRLVMTYQDNHYFYDTAKDNKTLIYGIAELDVTPTTLVTAGISYTRQDSVPWNSGLPRYQTGADLELPRSTSIVFPWNRWDFDTTEIFGGIEQKIGEEWTAKLNFTHNRQSSTQKLGYSDGTVNPNTGAGPLLIGIYTDYASKQFSAEATLSGAFTLFGQRQEVTFGVNRADTDGGGLTGYAPLISSSYAAPYQPYPGGPLFCYTTSTNPLRQCPVGTIAPARPPIDVFNFDPNDPLYTEPGNSLPRIRYPEYGMVQSGAFINLRLTAFDRLHLTTGLHWSRYEYQLASEDLCTTVIGNCAGKAIGDVYGSYSEAFSANDFSWPPPVNVSFDVTKQLTVYAGYSDIYRSQAYYITSDSAPLPPITGSNWEAGIKWSARDGRINLSLAAYSIKEKGFGTIDPPDYSGYYEAGPGIYCCYVVSPNRTDMSQGIDAEVTGELRPGWQIAASYTYNENKQVGSYYTDSGEGLPFASEQPRHLYKLWVSYDFGAAGAFGALSGLTLSGGINGQSSGYRAGSVCVNLNDPDLVTGVSTCKSFDEPDTVPFEFTVAPYVLASARIDYRFSDQWSLAVNLENIFDKTYYQTVGGGVSNGNWYGAPRSITASLSAKW